MLSVPLLALFLGCDTKDDPFRPTVTGVPHVTDLGELAVTPADAIENEYDPSFSGNGSVLYTELGAPENPGVIGGASFEFTGTGGCVQIVMDPEAVFWTMDLDPNADETDYLYEDNYQDDGDADLLGGLSAYYTGSPGVEIGGFEATYTDPLGVDHTIEFNECEASGYGGTPDAHPGRGYPETCVIDTAERVGVKFTILARTFSLPIDDSVLNLAVGVFETDRRRGSCQAFTVDECFFRDEVRSGESAPGSREDHAYFPAMEDAFCSGPRDLNQFCEENPDVCGDPRSEYTY